MPKKIVSRRGPVGPTHGPLMAELTSEQFNKIEKKIKKEIPEEIRKEINTIIHTKNIISKTDKGPSVKSCRKYLDKIQKIHAKLINLYIDDKKKNGEAVLHIDGYFLARGKKKDHDDFLRLLIEHEAAINQILKTNDRGGRTPNAADNHFLREIEKIVIKLSVNPSNLSKDTLTLEKAIKDELKEITPCDEAPPDSDQHNHAKLKKLTSGGSAKDHDAKIKALYRAKSRVPPKK